MQSSMFIWLDVHKATISSQSPKGSVAARSATGDNSTPSGHIRKLVKKLGANGRHPHFCYAAGPCGYGLHRQLVELGHDCMVVAFLLIPVKRGDSQYL